ncbi:MAG: hypothetical protein HY000_22655 [Planctomycetes bacterium]|nr:hypothetical protein [Planctomycetota bacterium]
MLARERGIYVSIMLFEGWELKFATWSGHPFHKHNNVNGIDGDPNGDGKGLEIQTLQMPAVVKLQKAYVRKVIDTVNDLDNVLYEISNESSVESWEWQFEMIHYVKAYEATKPKRHPVGMTSDGFGGPDDTDILFRSPADWISPSPDKDDYKNDPPGNSGSKVILLDTDHLWGIGGNRQWVWKSFLRGHNPIWMDPYDEQHPWSPKLDVPANAEAIRKNLGYTRRYAEKMNLTAMTPHSDLASSRYCMANPGKEYLVYLPEGGEVTVDLSAALGEMRSEWFDPATGKSVAGDPVAGGSKRQLTPPFKGEAVLYIVKP